MTTLAPARIPDSWQREEPSEVRLSEVVSALSFALDITEGQTPGHAVRTCLIGMRLGQALQLTADERSSLFYALLLKDLGCSSNAARLCQLFGADDRALKFAHKLTDWTSGLAAAQYALAHVLPGKNPVSKAWHALKLGLNEQGSAREMTQTRCERGADIASMLGLGRGTAEAIRSLDEHWDGQGMPRGDMGTGIPLLSRITSLAQTVEVFAARFGVETAYNMAHQRSGTWFDPELVRVLDELRNDVALWGTLASTDALEQVSDLEPADRVMLADENRLDRVAEAFARVIDAKSPYTATHSEGVATIAVGIGRELGMKDDDLRTLRRAGLLHDIGKLGVSNLILDKPGRLTDREIKEMRKHPRYTAEILERVGRFREFAEIAASHHERLDGTGYHRGVTGSRLCPLSRVLAVADIAEALSAERPYRRAMAREEMLLLMKRMVGGGICGVAFEGLMGSLAKGPKEAERVEALETALPLTLSEVKEATPPASDGPILGGSLRSA